MISKENMIFFIIASLFIYISTLTSFHYKYQVFYGLMTIAFIVSIYIKKRLDPFAALLFFYSFLSGSILSTYPVSPYLSNGPMWMIQTDLVATHSLVFILMIFLVNLLTEPDKLIYFFSRLAFINSLLIIGLSFFYDNYAGMMLNLSMDATFISIMFPFLIEASKEFKKKIDQVAILAIPVIAILISKSSIGVGGLAVSIVGYFFAKKDFKIKYLSIPVFILILAFFYDPNLFDSNGRVENWKRSIDWFFNHGNIYTGMGLGTYWRLGPFIQKLQNPGTDPRNLFNFMHSDFLQIFFEMGLIGLFLSIGVFLRSLIKSLKDPYLFASVLTFGAVCFFNMPLRFILTSTVGMTIIISSLRKKEF